MVRNPLKRIINYCIRTDRKYIYIIVFVYNNSVVNGDIVFKTFP